MIRGILRILRGLFVLVESRYDGKFLDPSVPQCRLVDHGNWKEYLYSVCNKEGLRVLEVGSREVTGVSDARKRFSDAEYIGFDYYPGRNVDVVGDAHKLSSYFNEGEKFDLVYSSACFEHFAMPWVVAVEISKLLKVGGLVFIETHFSWSSHERPSHFFQFSDLGLKVLFSKEMGFECIEAGMSNPIVGRYSSLADSYLRNKPVHGLYCHSQYLGRKVRSGTGFDWAKFSSYDICDKAVYPITNGESRI